VRQPRAVLLVAADEPAASQALARLRQQVTGLRIVAIVRVGRSIAADETIEAAARGRYGFALSLPLLARLRRPAEMAWAVVESLDDPGYRRVAALLRLVPAPDKRVLGPSGEIIPFPAWLERASIAVGPVALAQGGLSSLARLWRRWRAPRLLRGPRPPWGFKRINIGISDRCNHRCIMCSEHSPYCTQGGRRMAAEDIREERDFGLMDPDMYRHLLRDLVAMGTGQVEFCGIGDPLVHPQGFDFLRQARDAGLWLRLVTNAALLDAPRARELAALPLDELHVSINAGRPETYARVHGVPPAVFGRVLETIRMVAQARREGGASRPVIETSLVVQALNYAEPMVWARTMAEAGADRLTFSALGLAPAGAPVSLSPEQLAEAKENVSQAAAWARSKGLQVWGTFGALAESGPAFTDYLYMDMPCYIGYIYALITARGRIHVCCACERVVGELREGGFSAAWRGERYRRFREEALSLPGHLPGLDGCSCMSCPYGPWNLEFHRRLWHL